LKKVSFAFGRVIAPRSTAIMPDQGKRKARRYRGGRNPTSRKKARRSERKVREGAREPTISRGRYLYTKVLQRWATPGTDDRETSSGGKETTFPKALTLAKGIWRGRSLLQEKPFVHSW